jgi:hypothetical protein
MPDQDAAFREQMHQQGQETLRRIASEEASRPKPKPTQVYKSAADLQKLAKDRHTAELLADSIRRGDEVEKLRTAPLATQSRNPYELLTQDELLALSAMEQREAAQKEEYVNNMRSLQSWTLAHSEFPATADALNKISQWCFDRGLSVSFQNLDAAWSALQAGGMRPDYSNRNKAAHERNAEDLRSMGVQVIAPPKENATPEEIDAFYRTQPPATIQNLQQQDLSLYEISMEQLEALAKQK